MLIRLFVAAVVAVGLAAVAFAADGSSRWKQVAPHLRLGPAAAALDPSSLCARSKSSEIGALIEVEEGGGGCRMQVLG